MALSSLLWVPESQMFMRPAEDAYHPSLPWLSQLAHSPSFSVESLALMHSLEWCHFHRLQLSIGPFPY